MDELTGFTSEERLYLNELEDLESGLTDWELGFICDIRAKGDRGFSLSEAQSRKLESIYEQRCK